MCYKMGTKVNTKNEKHIMQEKLHNPWELQICDPPPELFLLSPERVLVLSFFIHSI